MMLNMVLLGALSEAAAKNKAAAEAEDPETDTTPANDEEGADAGTDDTATQDDAGDTGEEEPTEDGEENGDETEEEQTDESKEGDEIGDDFSMDSGDDDDGPPPDGLVDPDDDGSGDEPEEDAETNVQPTILQLPKLDRTLLKRKCYNDYQDFRSSITAFRNTIEENEATVEPEIRSYALDKLNSLYATVTDYLKYKFMIMNYEENLKNYAIFITSLQEIVDYVATGGEKPMRKLTVSKKKPKSPAKPKKTEKELDEQETDEGTEPEEGEDNPPEESEPEEPA